MNLEDLFKRLQGQRIVSVSSHKDRAALEYSVILTVEEYEQLNKLVNQNTGTTEMPPPPTFCIDEYMKKKK